MYVLYHIFRWLFALRNCSKRCGEGVSAGSSTRHRVEAITAAFGGADCEGTTLQHQRCNDQPCPIDCEWKDLVTKNGYGLCHERYGWYMVNIWLMIVNGIISWYNMRGKCHGTCQFIHVEVTELNRIRHRIRHRIGSKRGLDWKRTTTVFCRTGQRGRNACSLVVAKEVAKDPGIAQKQCMVERTRATGKRALVWY